MGKIFGKGAGLTKISRNSAASRKRALFRERRSARFAFWRRREKARLAVWLHFLESWQGGRPFTLKGFFAPFVDIVLVGMALGLGVSPITAILCVSVCPEFWSTHGDKAGAILTVLPFFLVAGMLGVAAAIVLDLHRRRRKWLGGTRHDEWLARGQELRAALADESAPSAELLRLDEACNLHRAMGGGKPGGSLRAVGLGTEKAQQKNRAEFNQRTVV
jgi:hypothetical protein